MGSMRTNDGVRGRALVAAAVLLMGGGMLAACSSDDGGGAGSAGQSGTPAADADAPAEGTFDALAYNVAGLPVEVSSERPDVNLPLISPLLNDYDVVLAQEIFDWWDPDGLAASLDFTNYVDRFLADTDHEHLTDPHPGPEAVDLDLDLRPPPIVGDGLLALSRFPIGETVRVPWASCFGGADTSDGGAGDCLAMKGFALTRIEIADGVVVDFYNLHAEAGGTETDQQLQADGFEQLAAFIRANSEGNAIVLGGDTNLHTNLDHPDGSGGADIEIWETFLAETGLTDGCAATECDFPGRIDKFAFRSGGGVDLELTGYRFETEVFVDDAGEDLSDHQALAATFTWRRS